LKTTRLLAGENIRPFDFVSHSQVGLLYSSDYEFLAKNCEGFDNTVSVRNHVFAIRGILADGRDNERKPTSSPFSIQMSIPYPPFNDVFHDLVITYSVISKDMSHDIPLFSGIDGQLYGYVSSWSIKTREKQEAESYNILKVTIICLLSLLTCISISIIFMLEIKTRVSEIGIRRVYGASADDICFEFMKELFTVCALAILLGIMLFSLFSLFISVSLFFQTKVFSVCIDFGASSVAVALMLLSGAVSSLLPSLYASKMNVIDIIQEEK
jgi:ABC-type antimicrobial peptide transport system permease subunit